MLIIITYVFSPNYIFHLVHTKVRWDAKMSLGTQTCH